MGLWYILYMRKHLTSIRLDPAQMAELEKIAKIQDRTTAYLIRKAVAEFIERTHRKEQS